MNQVEVAYLDVEQVACSIPLHYEFGSRRVGGSSQGRAKIAKSDVLVSGLHHVHES